MPVICLKNYYLAYDFRIELAQNITELPQKESSKEISKKNLKQLIFKNILFVKCLHLKKQLSWVEFYKTDTDSFVHPTQTHTHTCTPVLLTYNTWTRRTKLIN